MARAGAKMGKVQRAEVRSILADLDRRGYTQMEMVGILRDRHGIQLTQPMVSGYLKQVWQAYQERERESQHAAQQNKCEQYRMIRKLAWEAYDRSQQDATKVVEEAQAVLVRAGEDPTAALESAERLRRIVTVEGRLPDNAYLRTILETLEAERVMLGLDAPKQVVQQGSGVHVTTNIINVEQLTKSFKEQALLEAKGMVEQALPQAPVVGLKELPQGNGEHRNGEVT